MKTFQFWKVFLFVNIIYFGYLRDTDFSALFLNIS